MNTRFSSTSVGGNAAPGGTTAPSVIRIPGIGSKSGEFALKVPAHANVYKVHIIAPAVRVAVVEPRDRPRVSVGMVYRRTFQFVASVDSRQSGIDAVVRPTGVFHLTDRLQRYTRMAATSASERGRRPQPVWLLSLARWLRIR